MKSIIKWIDIEDKKPKEYGWYMTVSMPTNYIYFKNKPNIINDWITKFGIDKTWFNEGEFWARRGYVSEAITSITNRIIYWAEIPEVPKLKGGKI